MRCCGNWRIMRITWGRSSSYRGFWRRIDGQLLLFREGDRRSSICLCRLRRNRNPGSVFRNFSHVIEDDGGEADDQGSGEEKDPGFGTVLDETQVNDEHGCSKQADEHTGPG